MHDCRCLWGPGEGVGPPGAGVIGGREPPNHLMWMLDVELGSSARPVSTAEPSL